MADYSYDSTVKLPDLALLHKIPGDLLQANALYILQAGLEDNPPVYVLGGNIVPLGASGMMTTSYLRASNLTLLVAFSSAQAPTFERCGQGCAAHSSSSLLVTCGHMYLDQGLYPNVSLICSPWKACLIHHW